MCIRDRIYSVSALKFTAQIVFRTVIICKTKMKNTRYTQKNVHTTTKHVVFLLRILWRQEVAKRKLKLYTIYWCAKEN